MFKTILQVFVLDEADVMIATQGHQDQSIRIQKNLSSECQMMLFSATYDQDVMNFAENVIANPVVSSVANHFKKTSTTCPLHILSPNLIFRIVTDHPIETRRGIYR